MHSRWYVPHMVLAIHSQKDAHDSYFALEHRLALQNTSPFAVLLRLCKANRCGAKQQRLVLRAQLSTVPWRCEGLRVSMHCKICCFANI